MIRCAIGMLTSISSAILSGRFNQRLNISPYEQMWQVKNSSGMGTGVNLYAFAGARSLINCRDDLHISPAEFSRNRSVTSSQDAIGEIVHHVHNDLLSPSFARL